MREGCPSFCHLIVLGQVEPVGELQRLVLSFPLPLLSEEQRLELQVGLFSQYQLRLFTSCISFLSLALEARRRRGPPPGTW